MAYAENTTVPVEKSRAEIERILERYGATAFMYGWDQDRAVIEFMASDRRVRFVLPLPDRNDRKFTHQTAQGRTHLTRTATAQVAEYEKATRQRWRALTLVVKAKLEAVESGITEFEDEFLAHIVLPNGTTAGQWMRPQIAEAYETGAMPPLMPELGTGES